MKQLAVLMAATVSWAGVRNSIWAPVLATFGAFIVHFARRVVQVALFLTVLLAVRASTLFSFHRTYGCLHGFMYTCYVWVPLSPATCLLCTCRQVPTKLAELFFSSNLAN